MGYEKRIQSVLPELPAAFFRVADFLLHNHIEAAFMPALDVADRLGVDAATVVRFSQRIGYAGYPALRKEVRERVKAELLIDCEGLAADPESMDEALDNSLSGLVSILKQTSRALRSAEIAKFISALELADRVFVLGESTSLPVAMQLRSVLEAGAFPVQLIIGGTGGLTRMISQVTAGDLVIAVQLEEGYPLIVRALRAARSRGALSVVFVKTASQTITSHADIVFASYATTSIFDTQTVLALIVLILEGAFQWKWPERWLKQHFAVRTIQDYLIGSETVCPALE